MIHSPLDLGGLDALREVARLARTPAWATPEIQSKLIEEEASLRDELISYGYAFDGRDLEAVMRYFADDVVITNPRGTYSGSDVVRKNYKFLFEQWPSMRHFWTNITVRFPDRADEALRVSYVYGLLSSPTKAFAAGGTDAHRLRKIDGRWRIVERYITDDLSYPIKPYGGPLEDKPED